jgi:hypothetical protein
MIEPALVAALAAVIGGVAAISARDSRFVVGGLFVAMIAAPLAASPEPSALTIAYRAIGALLAAYLLWVAVRSSQISSEGSGFGVVAEIVLAVAAFGAGWFIVPVKPLAGPVAAQAAGISLAAMAIVPLAGRNVLRIGTAATLMTLGLSMALTAWVGPTSPLLQLVLMMLIVGILGATSLLMSSSGADANVTDAPSTGVAAEAASAPADAEAAGTAAEEPPPDQAAPAKRASKRGAAGQTVSGSDSDGAEMAPGLESAVTLRTSRSRSPRAIRQSAPAGSPSGAAGQADEAAGENAAAETTETTPGQPVYRVRRIRPREPRQ